MNAALFLQLDRVIHEKGRMAIMSMLAASPGLSFTELRDTLQLTDGNLTAHVRTLQEAGYVAITKTFEGSRSLTTFALTAKGTRAFTQYVDLLEEFLRQAKINR
jgi:DNA-binding MarR family transcriptional regulator